MLTNTSVWARYQPGFVDPAYVPYLRTIETDKWGNEVSINKWQQQGCSGLVEPALVRVNKGLTFQRMFDSDPCPSGFVKSKEDSTYCVRVTPKHEPVFFTEKAFIPKKQYWGGYADMQGIKDSGSKDLVSKEPSSNFDLRTVNPFNGKYTIYYESNKSSSPNRYSKPVIATKQQYDKSWYLKRTGNYAISHTNDSYLG